MTKQFFQGLEKPEYPEGRKRSGTRIEDGKRVDGFCSVG